MSSVWVVVALALLPAAGNFLGALLAEFSFVTPNRLNRALHAASGIVIAVVAVELMPTSLAKISGWTAGISFALGGAAYVAMEALIDAALGRTSASQARRTSMWMIYAAVAVDLFSDGILIGAGSAVSFSMAVVLALGQVMADVPEGYATLANMKDKGTTRAKRLTLASALVIPVLGSALGAYYLLRDADPIWQMSGLTFTAGLLTVAAVEDMVSEAHEGASDTRWSVAAFVGGFVLFTFVSAGLGG